MNIEAAAPQTKHETIENPLIGDTVTFLKTATQTNGAYTEVLVTLMPGGGNSHHYHTSFSETFIPVEGALTVGLNKTIKQLLPGEFATVKPMESHYFANKTQNIIRFKVKLSPANAGFEEGLRIAYGLARDGKTSKKGIPKKLAHLAVLICHTDTNMYGIFTFIAPLLQRIYKRAKRKGVLRNLQLTYCCK